MIISHKYKFIFLKTNKTAGTSIEIALSKFCGKDDIITPVSLEDEKLRKKSGGKGPQHYHAPLADYNFQDIIKLFEGKKKRRYYNHISAQEVKALVGEDIWNNYYTFCFERNPWDRIISNYFWHYKSEPRPSLLEYIESQKERLIQNRGYNKYTINGEIAVDKVGRYEKMSEELEEIRKRIGIPEKIEIPYAKSKYRKDKRSYRDILSTEEQKRISELFSDEIALLEYTF